MFSCFSKNYLQTTEISLFLNTPAFIFSGFVYPLWAMPALHTWFAQLMPFTHFIDGFLKLGIMGTSLASALPEISRLSVFVAVPLIVITVFLSYHKRKIINKTETEFHLNNGEIEDV
jgi:ABC-2 type transport system permease protein